MKRILFLCVMLTNMITFAAAQKATVSIQQHQNGGSVTVVSDTTSIANDEALDFGDEADDSQCNAVTKQFPFNFVDTGLGNTGHYDLVALCAILLIFGGPILIVLIIANFIFSSRKAKYEVAREALRQGREIPQNIIKTQSPNNEELWKKGIKNVCLGIGLFLLLWSWTNLAIAMVGVLILSTGVGQIIIARTTGQNKTGEDPARPYKSKEEFQQTYTETVPQESQSEEESK